MFHKGNEYYSHGFYVNTSTNWLSVIEILKYDRIDVSEEIDVNKSN